MYALSHYASIIRAAERGDYCHGNGAQYVYVDRLRAALVTVDVISGANASQSLASPAAQQYLTGTPARRDVDVAARLRAHVLRTYHVEV